MKLESLHLCSCDLEAAGRLTFFRFSKLKWPFLEMFEKSEGDKDEIKIEISDAISEKDLVKFTINVTSKVAAFTGDFKVIRSYNDFVWLHTSLSENELYQGLLIPPKVSFTE